MAEKENNLEGKYVVGAAILLAALIISFTLYSGMGGVTAAIANIKSAAPGGANVQATGGSGQGSGNSGGAANQGAGTGTQAQPPAQQPPSGSGDWSFVSGLPTDGPSTAKVTVVFFSDPQCPFCEIAEGRDFGGSQYDAIRGTVPKILSDYVSAGTVKLAYSPMAFLGQESVDAVNAMLCARSIGGDAAYIKLHDKLVAVHTGQESVGTFSKANLKTYAVAVGLTSSAMASCIDGGSNNAQVEQYTNDANSVGVQGTPSFAVNGKLVSPDYGSLKTAINAALASS